MYTGWGGQSVFTSETTHTIPGGSRRVLTSDKGDGVIGKEGQGLLSFQRNEKYMLVSDGRLGTLRLCLPDTSVPSILDDPESPSHPHYSMTGPPDSSRVPFCWEVETPPHRPGDPSPSFPSSTWNLFLSIENREGYGFIKGSPVRKVPTTYHH